MTGGRIKRNHPLLQTKRGKLQSQRSVLNDEITKELRLQEGAQNLLRVTAGTKERDSVALELSLINSNVQLLRHKLHILNSALHEYQGPGSTHSLPLIPIPFKETKEAQFAQVIKDIIVEHFSEDGSEYDGSLDTLEELREDARRPERSPEGAESVRVYCAQLIVLQRRFFPQNCPIYFTWFDALSGASRQEKSLELEIGSTLFNLAAVYSQMAAREERRSGRSLELASTWLRRGAGALLRLSSRGAPSSSPDLKGAGRLAQLLLVQAMQCRLEFVLLCRDESSSDMATAFRHSARAATLSLKCGEVGELLEEDFPATWSAMAFIKATHFKALAHFWAARGVLATQDTNSGAARAYEEQFLWDGCSGREKKMDPTGNSVRALQHLNLALRLHDEALGSWEVSVDLHEGGESLRGELCEARAASAELRELLLPSEELFPALLPGDIHEDPPSIRCRPEFVEEVEALEPELDLGDEEDLFYALGPVSFFTVARNWRAPRLVSMRRGAGTAGFGFSIRGSAPVRIAAVEAGSLAESAGLRNGDVVVRVGGVEAKWAAHEDLVELLVDSGASMSLEVVSPCLPPTPASVEKTPKPPSTSLPIKFRAAYLWGRGRWEGGGEGAVEGGEWSLGEGRLRLASPVALLRRLSRSDAFLSLRVKSTSLTY